MSRALGHVLVVGSVLAWHGRIHFAVSGHCFQIRTDKTINQSVKGEIDNWSTY